MANGGGRGDSGRRHGEVREAGDGAGTDRLGGGARFRGPLRDGCTERNEGIRQMVSEKGIRTFLKNNRRLGIPARPSARPYRADPEILQGVSTMFLNLGTPGGAQWALTVLFSTYVGIAALSVLVRLRRYQVQVAGRRKTREARTAASNGEE